MPFVPAQEPLSQEQLRRRMKAALQLAGLTIEDLAERLKDAGYERGYGPKTLYKMQGESSDRDITPRDFRVLALGCGIDEAFFSVDFASAPDASSTEERLRRLERALTQQRAVLLRLVAGNLQGARELLGQNATDHPEEPPGAGQ